MGSPTTAEGGVVQMYDMFRLSVLPHARTPSYLAPYPPPRPRTAARPASPPSVTPVSKKETVNFTCRLVKFTMVKSTADIDSVNLTA